jgi:hypothetical protein
LNADDSFSFVYESSWSEELENENGGLLRLFHLKKVYKLKKCKLNNLICTFLFSDNLLLHIFGVKICSKG